MAGAVRALDMGIMPGHYKDLTIVAGMGGLAAGGEHRGECSGPSYGYGEAAPQD